MKKKQSYAAAFFLPVFIAWVVACVATLGSLFFSEVMLFPPCSMCWYQRIFMYPLVIIFVVALLTYDRHVIRYALPLVLMGWAISLYHMLIIYEIVPESASPCVMGVSCATRYIHWWGFVSIPLLSWLAFSLIFLCLYSVSRRVLDEELS